MTNPSTSRFLAVLGFFGHFVGGLGLQQSIGGLGPAGVALDRQARLKKPNKTPKAAKNRCLGELVALGGGSDFQ
jgi:hypothetical protein